MFKMADHDTKKIDEQRHNISSKKRNLFANDCVKVAVLSTDRIYQDNVNTTMWENNTLEEPTKTIDNTNQAIIRKDKRISNMARDATNCDNSVWIKEEPLEIDNTETLVDNFPLSCNNCNQYYDGFCSTCPMLSHVLNNYIITQGSCINVQTLPKYLLEIKGSFGETDAGVFALKPFYRGTIFGPFDGLKPVPSEIGIAWRFIWGALANTVKSNWMIYVNFTTDFFKHNLSIRQHKNSMYYMCSRSIKEGDELLVLYEEERFIGANYLNEKYCCKVIDMDIDKVYACTFCCLGFSAKIYLTRHKLKCPYDEYLDTPTTEIGACSFCKLYMNKMELQKYHTGTCFKRSGKPSTAKKKTVSSGGVTEMRHKMRALLFATLDHQYCKDSITTKLLRSSKVIRKAYSRAVENVPKTTPKLNKT